MDFSKETKQGIIDHIAFELECITKDNSNRLNDLAKDRVFVLRGFVLGLEYAEYIDEHTSKELIKMIEYAEGFGKDGNTQSAQFWLNEIKQFMEI